MYKFKTDIFKLVFNMKINNWEFEWMFDTSESQSSKLIMSLKRNSTILDFCIFSIAQTQKGYPKHIIMRLSS